MKTLDILTRFTILIIFTGFLTFCSSSSEPNNDPFADENELMSFSLENIPEAVVSINKEEKTIMLLFPFLCGVNLNNLKIKFSTSVKATSNLTSGEEYDLTQPKQLIITSASGIENKYSIIAEICSKTAIIVNDTQNDIIPLYNQTEFFININKVIDKAYQAGIPAYYVMLTSLIVNGDSSAWRLPNQLNAYANSTFIEKDDIYNAFDKSTILHKSLMEKGIGKVVIVGVSSMGCVIGTCRGAANLNYDVILITNAHGEPVGFRPESSVELCNSTFINEKLGVLLSADAISF